MHDALANVGNRQGAAGVGFNQIQNPGIGDGAAVERHGLRDDWLADGERLGGRRRRGEQHERGQTAGPSHQKACLTRTSSEYVRSSFCDKIHDRRSF